MRRSVAYSDAKGWFITAKRQRESEVGNALHGSAWWLKAVVPFFVPLFVPLFAPF